MKEPRSYGGSRSRPVLSIPLAPGSGWRFTSAPTRTLRVLSESLRLLGMRRRRRGTHNLQTVNLPDGKRLLDAADKLFAFASLEPKVLLRLSRLLRRHLRRQK